MQLLSIAPSKLSIDFVIGFIHFYFLLPTNVKFFQENGLFASCLFLKMVQDVSFKLT